MSAIDRLRRDHKLLRAKLDVLQTALRMGSASTWYILRELCFTLSRQLVDHIRREEELMASCRDVLSPQTLAECRLEHHDEPQLLRTINRLFVEECDLALEHIRPALEGLIPRLRRHMAEEESTLFPAIERVLAAREASEEPDSWASVWLHEELTVNRVIREHPASRIVFERLFINPMIEGYDCLDEVAWRHGIEIRELLQLLEAAIGVACPGGEQEGTAHEPHESNQMA